MDLNSLFDMLWGSDGMHPFGNPERLKQILGEQELEEEVCEFVKGNVRTKITYKFNKKGYLVSQQIVSTMIDQEDLQSQLDEALAKEDYLKAAEIKKKMNDKSEQGE